MLHPSWEMLQRSFSALTSSCSNFLFICNSFWILVLAAFSQKNQKRWYLFLGDPKSDPENLYPGHVTFTESSVYSCFPGDWEEPEFHNPPFQWQEIGNVLCQAISSTHGGLGKADLLSRAPQQGSLVAFLILSHALLLSVLHEHRLKPTSRLRTLMRFSCEFSFRTDRHCKCHINELSLYQSLFCTWQR